MGEAKQRRKLSNSASGTPTTDRESGQEGGGSCRPYFWVKIYAQRMQMRVPWHGVGYIDIVSACVSRCVGSMRYFRLNFKLTWALRLRHQQMDVEKKYINIYTQYIVEEWVGYHSPSPSPSNLISSCCHVPLASITARQQSH